MFKLNNYFNIKWLVLTVILTTIVIVLTHIPQESMPSQIQQSGIDKILHALAYGTITFFLLLSLKSPPSIYTVFWILCPLLTIGIVDEITQPLVNRQASFTDLLADAIGIITVLLLTTAVKRRFFQNKNPNN